MKIEPQWTISGHDKWVLEKLNNVMVKVDYLFCGLLRYYSVDTVKKHVDDLIILQQEGIIDQIIFSTWDYNLDESYPSSPSNRVVNPAEMRDIREYLLNSGIKILEKKPPLDPGRDNIRCQMLSQQNGMEICNPDNYIFRGRLDAQISMDFMRKMFTNPDEYLPATEKIFKRKVWVPWFDITPPYSISDECFFGTFDDMKALVHFDEHLFKWDAHVARFAYPFVNDYQRTYDYVYQDLDKLASREIPLATRLRQEGWKNLNKITRERMETDYILDLACYYHIINQYFKIENPPDAITFSRSPNINTNTRKWRRGRKPLDDNIFINNFSLEKISRATAIPCYNDTWLNNLFSGIIKNDKYADKIKEHVDTLK